MIYIDTSCLLKLFRDEPSSGDVRRAVALEERVIVSSLTELETLVQLRACRAGGDFTLSQLRKLEAELARVRHQPPFDFCALSGTIFQTALRQHRRAGELHCRSLDRLHLAAMEELEATRLMTHDEKQARAARDTGFHVLRPGRD